jgi:hypothetical protein
LVSVYNGKKQSEKLGLKFCVACSNHTYVEISATLIFIAYSGIYGLFRSFFSSRLKLLQFLLWLGKFLAFFAPYARATVSNIQMIDPLVGLDP